MNLTNVDLPVASQMSEIEMRSRKLKMRLAAVLRRSAIHSSLVLGVVGGRAVHSVIHVIKKVDMGSLPYLATVKE